MVGYVCCLSMPVGESRKSLRDQKLRRHLEVRNLRLHEKAHCWWMSLAHILWDEDGHGAFGLLWVSARIVSICRATETNTQTSSRSQG